MVINKKVIFIIVFIAIFFMIGTLYSIYYFYPRKIIISYFKTIPYNEQIQNAGNISIISQEENYNYWLKEEIPLPKVDIRKQHILISRYKIKSLYYTKNEVDSWNLPYGKANFDYTNSKDNEMYIYIMEPILLRQAIG